MAKSTEEKIKTAKQRLAALGPEGDRVKVRQAKKRVKRAQRAARSGATADAKRTDMDTRRQTNIDKANEKVAKKKAAEDAALAAAAEKAAEAAAAAAATEEAAE